MTATTFETPVGTMPLSPAQQLQYGNMSNLDLLANLYDGDFLDPLALNELHHRGLARPGDTDGEIQARVLAFERRQTVFDEIHHERDRQDDKWGGPQHDDRHAVEDFVTYIRNYAAWAGQMAMGNARDKARRRLVQVAALAVAVIEKIDREEMVEGNGEPVAMGQHDEADRNELPR